MNTTIDTKSILCPICYQIPGKEIYQCCNGHIFCDLCSAKIDTCPQCRVSLQGKGRARNLFMEEIMDKLDVDCPFSDEGCETKKVKRHILAKHQTSCKIGKCVGICDLLTLNGCNFVANIYNINHIVTHLETVHAKQAKLLNTYGNAIELNLEGFFDQNTAVGHENVYSYVLRLEDMISRTNTNILFVARIDKNNELLSWMLFRLNYHANATKLHAKISSYTTNTTWNVPVLHILEAEDQFKYPKLQIPIHALYRMRTNANNGFNYAIDIQIIETIDI